MPYFTMFHGFDSTSSKLQFDAHAHRLFASALHQPCVEQGAEGVHPICQRQLEVPPNHPNHGSMDDHFSTENY